MPPLVRDGVALGYVAARRGGPPAYADVIRGFLDQAIFLPTDDSAIKARILAGILALPQALLAAEMEAIAAEDSAASAAACRVPTLLINAAQPLADVARFKE